MDGTIIIILLSFIGALYGVVIYKLSVISYDISALKNTYYVLVKDIAKTNERILSEWRETLDSYDITLKMLKESVENRDNTLTLLKEVADLRRKDAENAKGKD